MPPGWDKDIHERIQPVNMLGRGRELKDEACLLTLHSLELNIRTPGHGLTRGRGGLDFVRASDNRSRRRRSQSVKAHAA